MSKAVRAEGPEGDRPQADRPSDGSNPPALDPKQDEGRRRGPTHAAVDGSGDQEADCAPHLEANDMVPQAFQRAVLGGVRAHDGVSITDVRPFRAVVAYDGIDFSVRLDQAYKRYRHGETDAARAAAEILAAIGAPGTEIQRRGPYPRLVRSAEVGPGEPALACDFDPGLMVEFVWLLPHGHVRLSEPEIQRDWEGPRSLLDESLRHLRERTEALAGASSGEGDRRTLRWHSDDGLDASAMLLPEFRASMAHWVAGQLVLGIPARGLLIATGDADPTHVAAIEAEVAEAFERMAAPLSPRLYRLG